jgi:far upstream element-binding protein
MCETLMLMITTIAAQRPNGTPNQGQPPAMNANPAYANQYNVPPPASSSNYSLPQPSMSGNVDLSNIKPSNSGSVSLADAIARARGIAAEKGVTFDASRNSA